MNTTIMNKKIFITSIILISIGILLITSSVTRAQSGSEFTVPLSDPAKRAKVKAHLNYGSITVKGTARKDILVRYTSAKDEERERDRERNKDADGSRTGLKRIGGGGMDLEVTENGNNVNLQSNSWSHRLDVELEVPSGADLNLHTYNGGDLMVTGVQGELVLTTYNGDIDLTFPSNFKATLKMKTEQGEIFTGFDVNVTSSGPVQTKDTKGGVYKVVLDDWKRAEVNGGGPEVTMKNYNGDILVRK